MTKTAPSKVFENPLSNLILVFFMTLMMTGCGTSRSVVTMDAASVLPDSEIALISTPGGADHYVNALIDDVDGEHFYGRWHVRVKPGWHTVRLFIPDLRTFTEYKIFTKPGKRYDLTGARQGWESARNADDDNHFMGAQSGNSATPLFLDNSNTFIDAEAYKIVQQENDQRRQEQIAAAKLIQEEKEATKRRNLPYIRKVGARICQDDSMGHSFIGFVENITDEKVQIRISHAVWNGNVNANVSGFTPSIVWDNPMNWTLCEALSTSSSR